MYLAQSVNLFIMKENSSSSFALKILMQRMAEEGSSEGGATPIASGEAVFNAEAILEGVLHEINIPKPITAGETKEIMEGGIKPEIPFLNVLLGKINAGKLLISIDFLAEARKIQPLDLSKINFSYYSRGR
jgi:hypothetical protein